MRLFIVACLLCSFMFGCNTVPVTQPTAQVTPNEPSIVTTPEIIRILEEESIAYTSTRHSQTIEIQLTDGSMYRGRYVPAEAGEYSKYPNLSDILNLVVHIKGQRPPDEVKEWLIECE